MRILALKVSALLALAFASCGEASGVPKPKPSGQKLLDRASLSFSDIRFDTPKSAVRQPLSMIKEGGCEDSGECTFANAKGVEHYFWDEDQVLVVKSVSAKRFVGKPINALGIGMARSRRDVIQKVRAFLPEAKVNCLSPDKAGEGEGISSCGATLGEGWIKILFDRRDNLIDVRVDAYVFT